MPIIQGKILEGSTVRMDGKYMTVVLKGHDRYRVFHAHNRGKSRATALSLFESPDRNS
ncbi:MAG: hypothetical protein GW748_07895 [Alphaproteobacteria bacterium]|nr:hypothetical protein [Alphaproteobacteria bacterium]